MSQRYSSGSRRGRRARRRGRDPPKKGFTNSTHFYSNASQAICRFFVQGHCRHGKDCEFLHPQTQKKQQQQQKQRSSSQLGPGGVHLDSTESLVDPPSLELLNVSSRTRSRTLQLQKNGKNVPGPIKLTRQNGVLMRKPPLRRLRATTSRRNHDSSDSEENKQLNNMKNSKEWERMGRLQRLREQDDLIAAGDVTMDAAKTGDPDSTVENKEGVFQEFFENLPVGQQLKQEHASDADAEPDGKDSAAVTPAKHSGNNNSSNHAQVSSSSSVFEGDTEAEDVDMAGGSSHKQQRLNRRRGKAGGKASRALSQWASTATDNDMADDEATAWEGMDEAKQQHHTVEGPLTRIRKRSLMTQTPLQLTQTIGASSSTVRQQSRRKIRRRTQSSSQLWHTAALAFPGTTSYKHEMEDVSQMFDLMDMPSSPARPREGKQVAGSVIKQLSWKHVRYATESAQPLRYLAHHTSTLLKDPSDKMKSVIVTIGGVHPTTDARPLSTMLTIQDVQTAQPTPWQCVPLQLDSPLEDQNGTSYFFSHHTVCSAASKAGQALFLFGGWIRPSVDAKASSPFLVSNQLYAFALTESKWLTLDIKGNAPSPRAGHSCVVLQNKTFQQNSSQLIVFGGRVHGDVASECDMQQLHQYCGYPAGAMVNDVARFDPTVMQWERSRTNHPPCPRAYHSAHAYQETKLIIFAGMDSEGVCLNDIWSFDLLSFNWTCLHSGSVDGCASGVPKNKRARASSSSAKSVEQPTTRRTTKRKRKTVVCPSGRVGSSTVITGDFLVVLGGCDPRAWCAPRPQQNIQVCGDVWAFNLITHKWLQLPLPVETPCLIGATSTLIKQSCLNNKSEYTFVVHGGWNVKQHSMSKTTSTIANTQTYVQHVGIEHTTNQQ